MHLEMLAGRGAFQAQCKPPVLTGGSDCMNENHGLCLWFRRASSDEQKEKTPFVTISLGLPTKVTKEVSKMDKNSLAHTRWNCKYHIVFAPKYRRKVIYGKIKVDIGKILRKLCEQKGVEIIEANLCSDHVHMLVSIPPKITGRHSERPNQYERIYRPV